MASVEYGWAGWCLKKLLPRLNVVVVVVSLSDNHVPPGVVVIIVIRDAVKVISACFISFPLIPSDQAVD